MSDLRELYQEVILDHNRKPRNFQVPLGFNHKAEGYNPLCGDRFTVYLMVDGDVIKDIGFEGSGCAISKASSSLMTTITKGKSFREIEDLFEKFHQMVTGSPGSGLPHASLDPALGKLAVFSGVCEFPSRVKCAMLAWHTLRAALAGKADTVSTEESEEEIHHGIECTH